MLLHNGALFTPFYATCYTVEEYTITRTFILLKRQHFRTVIWIYQSICEKVVIDELLDSDYDKNFEKAVYRIKMQSMELLTLFGISFKNRSLIHLQF
jgi:hypothetical protein